MLGVAVFIIKATMASLFVAGMYGASIFIHWMLETFGLFSIIPFAAVMLTIGVWIEKREQRRLGVKRPIWRWNND